MEEGLDKIRWEVDHTRGLSPTEKLERMDGLNRHAYALFEAGYLDRRPQASPEEVRRAFANARRRHPRDAPSR
jgi:hypothetical protein